MPILTNFYLSSRMHVSNNYMINNHIFMPKGEKFQALRNMLYTRT